MRQLLSSAGSKRFLEPQNPCHLLKINAKQIGISERTNEHQANTFTLTQAPGMQDLMIKCYLATLHLYKSGITLKVDQYIMSIVFMGKLSPWRWNDFIKTRSGSICIWLDPFHPENMLALNTATTHIIGKYKKTHLYVLTNLPGYVIVRCRREADAIGELNLQSKKSHRKLFFLSYHTSSLWKCVL